MDHGATGKPSVTASAERIQGLMANVPPALAMLAGMQLEVFTSLGDGVRDAADLASALGVAEEPLSRLLYGLVVCGLLERREAGFANSLEAANFLVKGLPGYLGGMHELLDQLWRANLETAQSLRKGQPAALHDFTKASDEHMAAMLRGMHASAIAAGQELLQRFDFSRCRSVVDVGGGSGGLAATLCHGRPGLKGILFDLPRTAELAAPILRETPGGELVSIEAGDILAAPPSGTHDAVVLRALVQVLAPNDEARAIANAAAALRPGDTIFFAAGAILDDDRMGPRSAVFLNLTFLNLYPAGASYTSAEHTAWLEAAGCGDARRITLPSGSGIIHAT